jgi:DnaJ-class molecular chaperone
MFETAMDSSLYNVLNIASDATSDDIRKAYKRLALLHHPDKNATGCTTEFEKIKEAYDILSDPCKRRIYDDNAHNCSSLHASHAFPNWKVFINDVMVSMFAMMAFPKDIVINLQVPFEDVYMMRVKKLNVRVKRWHGLPPTYQMMTECIYISLLNFERKYTFVGLGDDSLIQRNVQEANRSNIIVNVSIIMVPGNVTIDSLFSNYDLFVTQDMTLYAFYTNTNVVVPELNISIKNTQETSYIIKGHGLPFVNSKNRRKRGNVFVKINLDIPLKADLRNKPLARELLRRYFA